MQTLPGFAVRERASHDAVHPPPSHKRIYINHSNIPMTLVQSTICYDSFSFALVFNGQFTSQFEAPPFRAQPLYICDSIYINANDIFVHTDDGIIHL